MLTPDQMAEAADGAAKIAEDLHDDILGRIIERIVYRLNRGYDYILTSQDKWQIEVLQDAGMLLKDIQKAIAKATGLMESEIIAAFKDLGGKSIDYDDKTYIDAGLPIPKKKVSPAIMRIIERNYEKTLGEWYNFTGMLPNDIYRKYIEACDMAYIQVVSQGISIQQAIREALARLVDSVRITYPSGHKDTIETAVTRAVRTGIAQTTGDITLKRMEEMGVDLVVVSSHLGARPDHQVWQGKIYSLTGTGYPHFQETTKYGTVKGLCGANCRHSFGPYFDGMRNPFDDYDSEKNKKAYELQQKQRSMERAIRKTKQELVALNAAIDAGAADIEPQYRKKAGLLKKQNEAYSSFCEENNLKTREDRVAIAQWSRKQANNAGKAAK